MGAEEVSRIADEAGFVFRGKVVEAGAADTVAVEVEEVLRGTDVLRGLVGTAVTVVSDDAAAVSEGDVHVFFTNVVSLGDHVVAREVTRREASDDAVREIAEGVRITAERPVAERIAGADMVVQGRVTSTKRLAGDAPPSSEHDPQWAIARVAVADVIKGRASRKTVDVLFASSRDIAWYRAPKLEEGASGVLILRTRHEDEAPSEVAESVYQATDPLDFLPDERASDVRRLVEDSDGGER
jgi:hypothetical protein